MRVAVYRSPEHIEVDDVPLAELGAADVLLGVEACGVCGSDVASYLHGHYATPGQVLGHEMSAVVQELGQHHVDSGSLRIGDRVAVRPARSCLACPYCRAGQPQLCGESGPRTLGYGARGGYADSVLVTDAVVGADVIRVPADLPPDEVVWAEPLAVAVHAVERALGTSGGSLLVLGGGSIGLCVVAAARAMGIERIALSEPRAGRRRAAEGIGAEPLDPSDGFEGLAFDALIDSSGSSAAIEGAIGSLRPGAAIVLVGLGDGPVPWPVGAHDVVPSFAYTDADFVKAVDLIVEGRVRLGSLITHRFGLAGTGAAIAASAHDPSVIKAVVEPRADQAAAT